MHTQGKPEERRNHKSGNADTRHGQQHEERIRPAVAPVGCQHARGNAQHNGNAHAQHTEPERHRKSLRNDIRHLHSLTHQRGAEIALAQDSFPVVQILHQRALVEPIKSIELRHDVLRQPALTQERIARQQTHQEKGDGLQHENHEDTLAEALEK